MIAFDLHCAKGHAFEGWFDSSEAFEDQKARGLVSCPVCGHEDVTRVISPVRSVRSREEQVDPGRLFLKAVRDYVDTNFENVGAEFAKEALKIHYGVSPKRNIRGSSTSDEEDTLRQEGISFFKLPLPENLD